MRSQLVLLSFLIISISSYAQNVDIPDPNFKAALIGNGVDTNSDGEIQVTEAELVNFLNISNSNISDLTGISSFVNLDSLICANNQLMSLDVTSLSNLESLNCSNNQLESINFENNNSLWMLSCNNNQLMSLDVSGLNSLYDFDCSNNELVSLNITNCPELWNVQCENNNLSTFDFTGVVPSNLLWVNFGNNDIIEFIFPPNFEIFELNAEFNQVVNLDLSNVSISIGDFSNNPLQTVNVKNGHQDDIATLALEYDNIQFICTDENELEDIMNDIDVTENNISVSSYCTFEPAGDYNRITGSVRLDLDSNGCDTSDSVITNMLLEINDGINQGYVSTNQIGDYYAYFNIGDYTIIPNIDNPNWFIATPNTANVSFVDYNNFVTQDFCFRPNGVHQDVEVTIVPIVAAQPGFDALYNIIFRNKGNQITSGDIDFSYDDSVLDFVSSSASISSQSAGSLVWDYTDLNPFENRSITVTLNVNSPTETPAVNIDDQLDFDVIINPIVSDEFPLDNEFNLKQVVVGSYDPNDITCLEGDIVTPDKIGEYLHYNINFENTGTAAATFIVVKDVIDDLKYDISSLQIMYASHVMQTRVVGETIEFIFDNINLAPNGKGNVVFKIKTKDTLSVGDDVSNEAEIFFDYNFPIVTNIATTSFQILSVDDFQLDNSISIYPNPVNDILNIKANSIIEFVKIFDVQGRQIFIQSEDDLNTSIDLRDCNKGIYFIEVKSNLGKKVKKLIKR